MKQTTDDMESEEAEGLDPHSNSNRFHTLDVHSGRFEDDSQTKKEGLDPNSNSKRFHTLDVQSGRFGQSSKSKKDIALCRADHDDIGDNFSLFVIAILVYLSPSAKLGTCSRYVMMENDAKP
ncbi:hypothetical protein ACI65C_000094, partial [Semiaphis heraclei]